MRPHRARSDRTCARPLGPLSSGEPVNTRAHTVVILSGAAGRFFCVPLRGTSGCATKNLSSMAAPVARSHNRVVPSAPAGWRTSDPSSIPSSAARAHTVVILSGAAGLFFSVPLPGTSGHAAKNLSSFFGFGDGSIRTKPSSVKVRANNAVILSAAKNPSSFFSWERRP